LGGLINLPPVTVGHGLEPSTKKDWLPTGSKTRSLALEKSETNDEPSKTL
jgi:hypothetical protein